MTWEDLKNELKFFSPEQLKQHVTVYVQGTNEYYSVIHDYPLVTSDENCDVLDPGHRYLVI